MAPKRRTSMQKMQGIMMDYDENDIKEIMQLLREDKRKISRCLRMVRGLGNLNSAEPNVTRNAI